MKKILLPFFAIMALAMIYLSCQGLNHDNRVMQDGEWEGTGEGRNGIIMVKSLVEDHILKSIKIISQSESPFAQDCIKNVIEKALVKQDTLSHEIDAVSGATLTSSGIIDAINMSIKLSKGEKISQTTIYKNSECDIVVIGAGGAGLSAAIEASSMGQDVVVLEKMGIIGGNTNYSTGGINAAETTIQEALGIVDSIDDFYQDTWKGGHEMGDPELIRSFAEHSPETIDWLISLGADLEEVGLMAGSSIRRTHRPKFGVAIGPHLIKVLKNAADERKVDIRTNNPVTGLLYEDGKVCGVNVKNSDGSSYSIMAKAVVIASGGFGANINMIRKYNENLADLSTLSHKGATGDAFEWVTKLNADLVDMEQIQIHPTAEAYSHVLISEAVRGNGAILVNQSGNRFINEMQTRDVVSSAILAQENANAYLIFDQDLRESLASIETYVQQGILHIEDSISKLADVLGIDESILNNSISLYNEMQAAGVDSDYGRAKSEMPRPIAVSPFYAIKVSPAIHHTMGGIHVDPELHVLTENDEVILGLYAAGEVTGGLHGANRLGGNGVADIVINGKIAGNSAALYAQEQ